MSLPWRTGLPGRPADLPLPPGPLPRMRGGRPLKRWRYLGAFGPSVMVCAGAVRIGGFPQHFRAVWDRDRRELEERTGQGRAGVVWEPRAVSFPGVSLTWAPSGEAIETVSAHGAQYAWTRKTPVRVTGTVAGRSVDLEGIVDESAGFHARRTAWSWSAGVGETTEGRPVTWNLVSGIHDDELASERSVWVDGRAAHVAPVRFDDGLTTVTGAGGERLRAHHESERARHDRLVLLDSRYRQPFVAFTGTLPGGIELARGTGVMERHDVRW